MEDNNIKYELFCNVCKFGEDGDWVNDTLTAQPCCPHCGSTDIILMPFITCDCKDGDGYPNEATVYLNDEERTCDHCGQKYNEEGEKMKTFIISITETLNKTMKVQANSAEEALEKVTDLYDAGQITLDYDNFVEVQIEDETEWWTTEDGKLKESAEYFEEVE